MKFYIYIYIEKKREREILYNNNYVFCKYLENQCKEKNLKSYLQHI